MVSTSCSSDETSEPVPPAQAHELEEETIKCTKYYKILTFLKTSIIIQVGREGVKYRQSFSFFDTVSTEFYEELWFLQHFKKTRMFSFESPLGTHPSYQRALFMGIDDVDVGCF